MSKYSAEKQKVADRKYYLKYGQTKRKSHKLWAHKNSAKRSLYQKEYRRKNLENGVDRAKEWRKSNPTRCKELWNRRRALVNNASGEHSNHEWETLKAQYNWTCPCCKRREPEIKLTEDHIVPLSRGGSDNIENIQPLCFSCNSSKRTKTIKY